MQKILKEIESKGFKVINKDFKRPWGGFIVIDENQAQKFLDTFFHDSEIDYLKISGKLSAKILIVKPKSRLSWQYHFRREEIWKVYKGVVDVIVSNNDTETEISKLKKGDQITIKKEQRHRIVGLNNWAVIAEIWQHTDKNKPSDENDIIRINDDFGR